MSELIIILLLFGIFSLLYVISKNILYICDKLNEISKKKYKCPHGYGETNDCPDCCH